MLDLVSKAVHPIIDHDCVSLQVRVQMTSNLMHHTQSNHPLLQPCWQMDQLATLHQTPPMASTMMASIVLQQQLMMQL